MNSRIKELIRDLQIDQVLREKSIRERVTDLLEIIDDLSNGYSEIDPKINKILSNYPKEVKAISRAVNKIGYKDGYKGDQLVLEEAVRILT